MCYGTCTVNKGLAISRSGRDVTYQTLPGQDYFTQSQSQEGLVKKILEFRHFSYSVFSIPVVIHIDICTWSKKAVFFVYWLKLFLDSSENVQCTVQFWKIQEHTVLVQNHAFQRYIALGKTIYFLQEINSEELTTKFWSDEHDCNNVDEGLCAVWYGVYCHTRRLWSRSAHLSRLYGQLGAVRPCRVAFRRSTAYYINFLIFWRVQLIPAHAAQSNVCNTCYTNVTHSNLCKHYNICYLF